MENDCLISHLMSIKHKCESLIIQSSTRISPVKHLTTVQQSRIFKVLQDLIARCQGPVVQSMVSLTSSLNGYCTVFQHALKPLEITAIVLSERMSKTARKK